MVPGGFPDVPFPPNGGRLKQARYPSVPVRQIAVYDFCFVAGIGRIRVQSALNMLLCFPAMHFSVGVCAHVKMQWVPASEFRAHWL